MPNCTVLSILYSLYSGNSLNQHENDVPFWFLCLQYTWWSVERAHSRPGLSFITRCRSRRLFLPLSAAEAAAQCSVLGTVEEIWDRRSRRQMATLCSLGAVCRYTILKPLIQHSLGLNAWLLQGQSWHYSCSSQAFFLPCVFFFKCTYLNIFPLTANIIVTLWFL